MTKPEYPLVGDLKAEALDHAAEKEHANQLRDLIARMPFRDTVESFQIANRLREIING